MGRRAGTGVRESWGWDEGYQWQARRCPQEVTGAFGDGHWGLWTQVLVGVQWKIMGGGPNEVVVLIQPEFPHMGTHSLGLPEGLC